jgi:hypothetical protein
VSDRYPGTTNPAIERRFKALAAELARTLAASVGQASQAAERRVIVVSEDLAAHLSASDPHPQYTSAAELAAALAALTLMGLADASLSGIEDGQTLIYDGGTFVPGVSSRPGITYRTIPAGVRVEVLAGEQYIVYDELVIDGELFIDGGEVVVL